MIGTHGGKGISNIIDVDDLKKSHLLQNKEDYSIINKKKDPMNMYRTF